MDTAMCPIRKSPITATSCCFHALYQRRLASCLNPDGTGNDTNWRIWEYSIAQKTFARIRCTAASGTTPPGDDVDPAYLPDGRIVFVSNRQVKSQQVNGFAYLDEYERERTTPCM